MENFLEQRVLKASLMVNMQHYKDSTTLVSSPSTFLTPVAPQGYENLELCVCRPVSQPDVSVVCAVVMAEPLVSIVIIFLSFLPFHC